MYSNLSSLQLCNLSIIALNLYAIFAPLHVWKKLLLMANPSIDCKRFERIWKQVSLFDLHGFGLLARLLLLMTNPSVDCKRFERIWGISRPHFILRYVHPPCLKTSEPFWPPWVWSTGKAAFINDIIYIHFFTTLQSKKLSFLLKCMVRNTFLNNSAIWGLPSNVFFQLVLILWMVILSSCLIWQIISFILPPNEYGCVYAWTTLGSGPAIDLQQMPILAKKSSFQMKLILILMGTLICEIVVFGGQKIHTWS